MGKGGGVEDWEGLWSSGFLRTRSFGVKIALRFYVIWKSLEQRAISDALSIINP